MTKVRGSKGFDALFSRVFDEPGLKGAVDNMHDDFSSRDAKRTAKSPAAKEAAAVPVAAEPPVRAGHAVKKSPPVPVKEVVPEVKPQARPVARPHIEPPVKAKVEAKVETPVKPRVETRVEPRVVPPVKPQFEDKVKVEVKVAPPVVAPVKTQVATPVEAPVVAPVEPPVVVKAEQPVAAAVEPEVVTPVEPQVVAPVEPPAVMPAVSVVSQVEPPGVTPVEPQAEEPVEPQDDEPLELQDEDRFEAPVEPKPEAPVESRIEPPAVSKAVPGGWNIEQFVKRTDESPAKPAEPPVREQPAERPRLFDKSGLKNAFDRLKSVLSSSDVELPSRATVAVPVAAPVAVQETAVAAVQEAIQETVAVPAEAVKPEPAVSEIHINHQHDALPDVKLLVRSLDLTSQARRRPLTEAQGRVLLYLFQVAAGRTNVEIISQELKMNSSTVRESLLVLVTDGYLYMLDKKRAGVSSTSIFSYKMNNYLCSEFASGAGEGVASPQNQSLQIPAVHSREPQAEKPEEKPIEPAEEPVEEQSTETVSSLPEEKAHVVIQPLLSTTVCDFWAEEGLLESQVKKWCSIFGIGSEQMYQQLEWARFDLVDNNRRETVKKDVISWFYDRLMITGGIYNRPANYRSVAELRAEAMQQERECKLSEQAKKAEIEFSKALQAFLADPEGQLYQELLGRVNSFALERLKAGENLTEEIGLDAMFRLHWGTTGSDPAAPSVSFALSGLGTGQSGEVGVASGTSEKRILLAAGWNLVGYDGASSQPVTGVFAPVLAFVESVWGWNDGKWYSFAPTRPANSLTTLEPGMGYWIKMKRPATLALP